MSAPDAGEFAIRPEDPKRPVSTVLHGRELHLYPVTDAELSNLTSPAGAINLAMLGMAFGAAVSFGIAYYTQAMPPLKTGFFQAGYYFGCALCLYFAGMVALSTVRWKKQIAEIKKRSTLPGQLGS